MGQNKCIEGIFTGETLNSPTLASPIASVGLENSKVSARKERDFS